MKTRCENCRFWKQDVFPGDTQDATPMVGLCTRYPPIISVPEGLEFGFEDGILGKEAFFPATPHNLLCGEHKPKEKVDGTNRKK